MVRNQDVRPTVTRRQAGRLRERLEAIQTVQSREKEFR